MVALFISLPASVSGAQIDVTKNRSPLADDPNEARGLLRGTILRDIRLAIRRSRRPATASARRRDA